MPPLHLLIKPASGLCNLRCKYCFYYDETQKREQASYGVMSLETLENVIGKALAYAQGSCTIAYQGGEPTLAGLDFFEESIRIQNRLNTRGLRIENAIQTNGVGLDENWARFFAQNHFLVGLSVDGTQQTHDCYRVDAQGKDTYARVLRTARLFDKYQVQYNILTVVHAQIARHAQAIYRQFRKLGFSYLQFIPCLDPLGEKTGEQAYSLTPQAFGNFLIQLFDLWYRDVCAGNGVSIRTFDNYIAMLLGQRPESCGMSGICGVQNVVEADGSVYPCDFYVLDAYRLGNLNQDGFETIEQNRRALRFIESSAEFDEKCRACRYFPICRGGCRRLREPAPGYELPMNIYCASYQMFFDHALAPMQALAASLRSGAR